VQPLARAAEVQLLGEHEQDLELAQVDTAGRTDGDRVARLIER
jgi:hypothetical protein